MIKNTNITNAHCNKWKPVLSLFSSPLVMPNLSGVQLIIEPKKVIPESKKEIVHIYKKESKNPSALF